MTIMQLVAEQGGREVTIKLIDATILQESDQRKVRGVFRDFVGNRDKRVFTWETVTNDFYVSSSFCYYVFFHVHVYYVQASRWQSKRFFETLWDSKTAISFYGYERKPHLRGLQQARLS